MYLDKERISRYNQGIMDERLEQHNLMGASPLFQNVQPDEAAAILARLQSSYYPRGTYILKQGIWHGSLHIIGSGHVSVRLPALGQPELLVRG